MDEPLLERESELAAIDALIVSGGVLVLEGPAGAGKTFLLAEAAAGVTTAGRLVLRARASELELEHSFGVVRQLLEPAVATWLTPSGARRCSRAWRRWRRLRSAPRRADGGDRFAVLHGLYWLVANLAMLEDRLLLSSSMTSSGPMRRASGFSPTSCAASKGCRSGSPRPPGPHARGRRATEIEAIVAEAGGPR